MPIDLTAGRGVLLSRKEEIDQALRHPEIFSSNMDAVDLKNKRPMIPLQIDPPEHKKFRKLLDPIFSPRKMARHGRRGVGPREPPHRRVHRPGRGGLRQGVLRALPLAGVPHPAGPAPRRAGPVPHHEGRHHPPRPRDRQAVRLAGGQRLPAEDRRLGLRLLQRDPRRARGGAARRPAVALPRCRGRGRPAHPRGHPRHLLPLPDRRARHRHRHPRLHVRLPGPAPRAAAPARRGPRPDPQRDRGAPALGDAGHGRGPGGRGGDRARPGARSTRGTRS